MIAVLDIIGEIIPDLVALDVSDNKLNVTEHMKLMVEKCPNLKMLHLGNNRVCFCILNFLTTYEITFSISLKFFLFFSFKHYLYQTIIFLETLTIIQSAPEIFFPTDGLYRKLRTNAFEILFGQ